MNRREGEANSATLAATEMPSPIMPSSARLQAAVRRRKRLSALTVAIVIGVLAAGVAVRISAEGHRKFVDGAVLKFRQTVAQGEKVLGGLLETIPWQKRN